MPRMPLVRTFLTNATPVHQFALATWRHFVPPLHPGPGQSFGGFPHSLVVGATIGRRLTRWHRPHRVVRTRVRTCSKLPHARTTILWPLSHKPCVAEHLIHRRNLASNARGWSALQQGRRECTRCAANQDATPTSNPCGFHTILKDPRHGREPWPVLTETAQSRLTIDLRPPQPKPPNVPFGERSFLMRTFSSTAPLVVCVLLRGDPSWWRGDTNVVSMANCTHLPPPPTGTIFFLC